MFICYINYKIYYHLRNDTKFATFIHQIIFGVVKKRLLQMFVPSEEFEKNVGGSEVQNEFSFKLSRLSNLCKWHAQLFITSLEQRNVHWSVINSSS